ncbi:MAG: cell division protein FtsZ [candidate division WOR-3 bacterium]
MKVYYDDRTDPARILVIGVGGAGCNAVNHMVRKGLTGAAIAAANTDRQVLETCLADIKIPLGSTVTRGLGAGADPEVGKMAAEESEEEIEKAIEGYDMVFIAAGMGGGTGTGASPVVARIAKEKGILVVAIVTKPFRFEGQAKQDKAEAGLRELREHANVLLVISNTKLAETTRELPIPQAFARADDILYHAARSVVDIIRNPGYMNVDFADVRTVMKNGGLSLIGIGEAKGENRAVSATKMALSAPLLDGIENISGADRILVNIQSPDNPDFGLRVEEMEAILNTISQEAMAQSGSPETIVGMVMDRELTETIRVTVIATGIKERRGFVPGYRFPGPVTRPTRTSRTDKDKDRTGVSGDIYSGFEFKRPLIDPDEEDDWREFGSRA